MVIQYGGGSLVMSKLCDYGCGNVAKYKFKNGKHCCSKLNQHCPQRKKEQSELCKSQDITSSGCNKLPYKSLIVDRCIILGWIEKLESTVKKPRYWTIKFIGKIHPDFYDAIMTATEQVDIYKVTLIKRIWLFKNDLHHGIPCRECGKIFYPKLDKYDTSVEVWKDSTCSHSCAPQKGIKKKRAKSFNRLQKISEQFDVKPKFGITDYNGARFQHKYDWECGTCGHNFTTNYYGQLDKYPTCKYCVSKYGNKLENQIGDIFRETDTKFEFGNRQIIAPQELDFVLPEHKLAIEVNGLFWHSDIYVDSDYHINKVETAEAQGYNLFSIFEDEMEYKMDIVRSRIKSRLGQSENRIYARKCEIREVGKDVKNKFLEDNHIQGKDSSSIRLGLYYEDKLCSIMTFGGNRKIMGKSSVEGQYELYRFCSTLNTQVIGGFSKLLKHFEKKYNPSKLTTYADRRWSSGGVYGKNGFTYSHTSKPNYWYFKSKKRLHRAQFQKHTLQKKLDTFDPNLTEKENMKNNGWGIVHDCGNLCFLKNYS